MNGIRLVATLPWAIVLALAGCGGPSGRHAPIVDHSVAANGAPVAGRGAARGSEGTMEAAPKPYAPPPEIESRPLDRGQPDSSGTEKDWRPRVYTVQPGDTLYGIAFNFGLDYHDIAALNDIADPTVIHPGQVLKLFPAAGGAAAVSSAHASAGGQPPVVSRPVVAKLPYSEQAVAQIEKMQGAPATATAASTVPTVAATSTATAAAGRSGTQAGGGEGVMVKAGVAEGNVPVKWEMPASGRVVAGFSEADNRKGIDIAGKIGQPVYASAPGKVVYSGTGLRGYGKLVIIKHNDVYLSAYAHNDKLLVKEGQMVSQGQMIAQMGSSDANRVALHFEIRKLGRPVDPAKYLVLPKS